MYLGKSMRLWDVINVQMRKSMSGSITHSGKWASLSDGQSDQSDSSVEHSQFIFHLYHPVEYLA